MAAVALFVVKGGGTQKVLTQLWSQSAVAATCAQPVVKCMNACARIEQAQAARQTPAVSPLHLRHWSGWGSCCQHNIMLGANNTNAAMAVAKAASGADHPTHAAAIL